jgi:hypothetical protein
MHTNIYIYIYVCIYNFFFEIEVGCIHVYYLDSELISFFLFLVYYERAGREAGRTSKSAGPGGRTSTDTKGTYTYTFTHSIYFYMHLYAYKKGLLCHID